MLGHIITLLLGAVGGYLLHAISMKVSFKQRTIDNKIKVYDSIIGHWVSMRNFVFHNLLRDPQTIFEFDKLYGSSQTYIGEIVLVSEDETLADDINTLNERLYRTPWLTYEVNKINGEMEDIKKIAISIVKRMQKDIKHSTILELTDFLHIFSGIYKRSKKL